MKSGYSFNYKAEEIKFKYDYCVDNKIFCIAG